MLQSMVVRRCGILNLSVKETGLFDMFADITTAIKVYSSACHQSVQLSMPLCITPVLEARMSDESQLAPHPGLSGINCILYYAYNIYMIYNTK
jgi:hypothetical protein